MTEFKIGIHLDSKVPECSVLFRKKPDIKYSFYNEFLEFIAWGDPIFKNNFEPGLTLQPLPEYVIRNMYGHFYYILLDKTRGKLFIGNSLFSILPVYYMSKNGNIIISDSTSSFSSEIDMSFNKRFLLENVLFNYQLFNNSYVNGVSLLPVNSYILISEGGFRIIQHTAIENFFVENPKSWKKSTDELSDIFISSAEKYFPLNSFFVSLTGGFDGRTLVSTGLYHNKRFSTYSFGVEGSNDIRLAQILSDKAGLPYTRVLLDFQYARQESLVTGLEFIQNSSGGSSFERAHYLYSAKKLKENAKFLITGDFGSEILRSSHLTGSLVSSNLFRLFFNKNFKKALYELESSPEFNWLNKESFRFEWSQLKDDLEGLPCFNPVYRSLTTNQQFYKIMFDEIFRKYFGAEIVNQSKYIINRTPYLDGDFVRSLLKTSLAGVYSDFYTQNPFKRFKGQVLYASIINRTFPEFSGIITDKGYRPGDLLNPSGTLRIAYSFVRKRLKRKFIQDKDPYSVNAAYISNKMFWEKLKIDHHLFNTRRIEKCFHDQVPPKDSFFIMLSQAWWYDKYLKEKL
jgi:asparagine synthase (glutamine-hydrolysing)